MSRLGPAGSAQDEEAEVARRGVIVAAALVIVGQLVFGVVGLRLIGLTEVTMARLAQVSIAAVILIAAIVRPRASLAFNVACFYALALPLLPFLWIRDAELAATGLPFVPLTGHKLLILAAAVMVPGPAAGGIALIALVVGFAAFEWYALGFDSAAFSVLEPWMTVVYGAVGIGLVMYRRHHRIIERKYAQVSADAAALAELARFLLAIRDMSSTPLQNLEIDTALLERDHPPTPAGVRRMRNAVKQLREMRAFLAKYDHLATWGEGQESLDPADMRAWLERLQEGTRGRSAQTSSGPTRRGQEGRP